MTMSGSILVTGATGLIGRRVVASLDLDATLGTIADVPARPLSNKFVLDLVGEDGRMRRSSFSFAIPRVGTPSRRSSAPARVA